MTIGCIVPGNACKVGMRNKRLSCHNILSATSVCATEQKSGRGIVTARDTSALLVIDMQNDFLATGGYYDEKAKRTYARQGKLSATDIDDLARVYLHPPTLREIREPYQDFV